MTLYAQYSNEAAFRDHFVRPLLNKMGFFLVTDYHGHREFGKDFVFSELHRFGGVRHYAAQVKHEARIRLGVAIDDLVAQINQAFTNPFVLPDSHREMYVSAVYIFNSGEITEEAKDDLVHRLGHTAYGENVFLLDGNRLDDLNRWATYQSDQGYRQKLQGLRNQLSLNILIWQSVAEYFEKGGAIESRGPLLHGIEEYLSQPLFPEIISDNEIAFALARSTNHRIHLYHTKISILRSQRMARENSATST